MPSLLPPVVEGLPAEQPVLSAGGLTLRPWVDADAPFLVRVYADPEVQRWHGESLDEIEAETYAARWAVRWQRAQRAGWAVTRREVPVGRVTLSRLALADGQAEVTYWTAPDARGTGVATEAVNTLAAWAFGLGLHRLELQHSTHNEASCRVANKAGFALEATKRSAVLHTDGWHDMHLHARLA